MILYNGISKWDLLDDITMIIEWLDTLEIDKAFELVKNEFRDVPDVVHYIYVRIQEYGQDFFD